MNELPQELIERISSFLPREDLRSVLTLHRKFRFAAERHSGAFAEFTVTENNSADFLTRFSGHRLLYLREVTFRPDVSATYDLKGNEVDDDGSDDDDDDDDDVDEDDDRVFCRESADEVRERDESFTRQMQFLFDILQRVEKQAGKYHAPGRYRLTIYNPIRRTENEDACPHRYMTSWRVRLLAKELPPIASIRSFRIVSNDRKGYEYEYPPWDEYAYTYRLRDNYSEMQESKLDLRVLIDLATSMPNLEYLGTRTGGYEWCETLDEEEDPCSGHYEHDWAGPRRDARHDFAAAVTSCVDKLPKTLRRATLDFLYPLSRVTDYDHGTVFPDLVGSNLTHDPFSTSLGILCNNLRHLQLRAMIDESIFPALSPQNPATSHTPWPHLELLDLMFHNARPDGTWYFQGTDGRGDVARGLPVTDASYPPYSRTQFDEDMDEYYVENIRGGRQTRGKDNYEFRIAPHANLILLLERFARAATQMPALKEAVIWSPIKGQNVYPERPMSQRDLDVTWGIEYAEPRSSINDGSTRQLDWLVGKWRPGKELHSLFQEIGRAKHGDELAERWYQDDEWEVGWSLYEVEGIAKSRFRNYGKCV